MGEAPASRGTEWRIDAMRRGEGRAASLVLGRAFAENPVARACLSHLDRQARLAAVTRLNRGLLEAARRAGEIELARDGARIAGAQLWYPPGRWPPGALVYPWMAAGGLGTGLRGALRYARYDHTVVRFQPREPHFYLFMLGVDPDLQGRGVGSALLRRFCARADEARTLACLETDRRQSVLLYQRHGFEVARELDIPALSAPGSSEPLHVWTMRRDPR